MQYIITMSNANNKDTNLVLKVVAIILGFVFAPWAIAAIGGMALLSDGSDLNAETNEEASGEHNNA